MFKYRTFSQYDRFYKADIKQGLFKIDILIYELSHR